MLLPATSVQVEYLHLNWTPTLASQHCRVPGIKYRHNVTGVGAVPGALSDAPFYEGHHGRPVDPSDRIDSKMYRIEFEDIVALHMLLTYSAVFRT